MYSKTTIKASFILITLFLSLSLLQGKVFANHYVGGQFQYTCLGNNTYEVEFTLMVDCAAMQPGNQLSVLLSNSCLTNQTLTLTQSTVTNISDICSSSLSQTACNTGGFLPGFLMYTYTGMVNLGGCSSYTLAYNFCCRYPTINLSVQDPMYIETVIYPNPGVCNSTPQFTAVRPFANLCPNSQSNISIAAYDPDGDSLVYSLQPALNAAGSSTLYSTGYSPSAPLSFGLTLDPSNGMLSVNTSYLPAGGYIVAYRVDEYNSNGVLLSTTHREVQFNLLTSCNNASPITNGVLSNISGATLTSPNSLELSIGTNFCFDITFVDSNLTDTLTVISNLQDWVPGANITLSGTNPVTATICGTPSVGWIGNAPLIISGLDNQCVFAGQTAHNVWIELSAFVSAEPDQSLCPGDTAFISVIGDSAYTWSVLSGDPIVAGSNFGCATCPTTWATPSTTTSYVVTGAPSGLSDTISVTIYNGPTISTSSSPVSICPGLCTMIGASGGAFYNWSTGDTLDSIQVCQPGTYSVTVTDTNGCIGVDSVQVLSYASAQLTVSADTAICPGDTAVLLASGNGSFLWSNGVSSGSNTVSSDGTYFVTLTTSNGCTAVNSVVVTLAPNPTVYAGEDTSVCIGNSIMLTASGANSYVWNNGTVGTSASYSAPNTAIVTGTNLQGCSASDTVDLILLTTPVIHGWVTDSNGTPLPSTSTYLLKHFPIQDSIVALDSVFTDSFGYYSFATAEPLVYIKAVPDPSTYPLILPTFSLKYPVFQLADSITTSACDTSEATVECVHGYDPGGTGFISGNVYRGAANLENCTGNPVHLLSLVLRDANGVYVAQTYTDVNGFWKFSNLLPGTYSVWADKPGVDLQLAPSLVLNSNSSLENVSLMLYSNRLELCIPVGITSYPTGLSKLSIFPNPGDGELTLTFKQPTEGRVAVQVIDALGARVWDSQWSGGTSVRKTLSLSHLSSGMYFLQVKVGEHSVTRKLVVQ